MPRHGLSESARHLRPSVFQRLGERIAAHRGPIFPLHIGDTHILPCAPAREACGRQQAEHYRYGPPGGLPEVLDALGHKLRTSNQFAWASRATVQVAAGATHALFAAARAVLDPGDEVLLLAPYWPLIEGIVRLCGAIPREVPLYQELYQNPRADLARLIAPHLSPKTVALYLTTPNNPDGKVLDRGQLTALAELAIEHDLWIFSDEVYEDYYYVDERPVSIATLPGMAERTLTVFSFSKSHAMAGLRFGYVAGPPETIALARKICNHTIYNVPIQIQQAALAALEQSSPFIQHALASYDQARQEAIRTVRAPFFAPEGACYLFLDLRTLLPKGAADCLSLLEQLLDAGVLLAPGDAFGQGFAGFARLCFAAVPPEDLKVAIGRLNEVLDRAARGAAQ